DARVERVAVREQLIELDLAEDGAKRRLRELRSLVAVVEHFDDGAARLDDAQEDDRVHLQRDVVARDDVLRRHFERFLPQRNADYSIDRREDQKNPWPFRFRQQAAETKDDATLVLRKDLDRCKQIDPKDDDGND